MLNPEQAAQQRDHARFLANTARKQRMLARRRLRTGAVTLGEVLTPVFLSPIMAHQHLLPLLGLAYIGAGHHGRKPGRLALELAAAMPFPITHWTWVGDLAPRERQQLVQAFYDSVGTDEPLCRLRLEPASRASL